MVQIRMRVPKCISQLLWVQLASGGAVGAQAYQRLEAFEQITCADLKGSLTSEVASHGTSLGSVAKDMRQGSCMVW